MATTINIPDLQDIAVQATSAFYNDGVPLNETLAKCASDKGLNSDQLQRAVEATNTLTFLKSASVDKDRTKEFPLADYREILKLASIPDKLLDSTQQQSISGQEKVAHVPYISIVKQAEDAIKFEFPKLSDKEKVIYLQKYAQVNKRDLENAEINLARVTDEFVKSANQFKNNPQAVELLSATSANNDTFEKIAKLLFNTDIERKDYFKGIFKSASVSEAQRIVHLYKQSEEAYKTVQYHQKAQQELEKLSFFQGAARKLAANSIKTVGTLVGKGVRNTISGVVGGVGKAVSGTANTIGTVTKNTMQNSFAKTDLGKQVKVPTKQMPPEVKKRIAATTTVVGAGFDVSMHNPTSDPINDKSGKVWDALQKKY